jgi:uncharacterized protein (TIGR00251 family)
MRPLEPHPQGSMLRVRAQPGARRDELRGLQDGELKVAVTQVAERGKANDAIIRLLAKTLQVARSDFELVSGDTSRHKRLLIRGQTVTELEARLRPWLAENTSLPQDSKNESD